MSTINVGKPFSWGIVDGVLFGYARVSTTEQNPAHQLAALTAAGVEPANIHPDHASGAKASRPSSTCCCTGCAPVTPWSSPGWTGSAARWCT